MDRDAVLVADQGMRILNDDKITTNAPYFLATNDELWRAWREVQSGRIDEVSELFRSWWRIKSFHLPNGGSVMRLEVRFDPTERV